MAADIKNLHPVVKEKTEQLISIMDKKLTKYKMRITQGYRSIAEQNEIYAQGRTKPGSIVTNAKGGQSYHNYGLAIDFCLISPDGKQASWDMNKDFDGDGVADWKEVVTEAKKLGFDWGGDWSGFKDYSHFEMTFGLSIKDLQNGKRPANSAKPSTGGSSTSTSSSTLKYGSKGSAVKTLQSNLKTLGYNIGKSGVDGIYGNDTVTAVKKFQKDKKLAVDGIAGSATLAAIKKAIDAKKPSTPASSGSAIVPYPGHVIKYGSKGKDVERIQRAVKVNPDGIYGRDTEAAVKAYQKRHGLTADGIVGLKTWNVMF
ncbi:L-alanoyl-D-glutamate peptidase [Bacillus phage SP-15]|uniref:L-alanoyl-D-glutamate peptidase n=1 Tax=Bacillus phage SP-15 TaxID=1792032 RepID=A0A127AWA8_9CAUD|nr:endolysin [Bacillus phage SP-15]AMM44867.1 L-alanoyl-D-glutamate peptidase [Bacillus phage SP-15]